jgi:hypothetical protein
VQILNEKFFREKDVIVRIERHRPGIKFHGNNVAISSAGNGQPIFKPSDCHNFARPETRGTNRGGTSLNRPLHCARYRERFVEMRRTGTNKTFESALRMTHFLYQRYGVLWDRNQSKGSLGNEVNFLPRCIPFPLIHKIVDNVGCDDNDVLSLSRG